MSAVNAGLTREEDRIVKRFLRRIQAADDNWAAAFKDIESDRAVLDKFFKQKIKTLKTTVAEYENTMKRNNVDYAVELSPQPHDALIKELDTLPMLSYLIMYSNLDVLNNLKVFGVDNKILTMINSDVLWTVEKACKGIPHTPPVRDFEDYIIDLAVQYSLDEEILDVDQGQLSALHTRLKRHHLMISKLLAAMATFMKIRTRVPYFKKVEDLENELKGLLATSNRGYHDTEIQSAFDRLTEVIMSAIAMYGSPMADGTEWFSHTVANKAVQRYLKLDPQRIEADPDYPPLFLAGIAPALELIANESQGSRKNNPPWFDRLLPMVAMMNNLGSVD